MSGMDIDVRPNISAIQNKLDKFAGRQLPFVTAVALTRTVLDGKGRSEKLVTERFDRPTNFTKRAFGVQTANKRNLSAKVFAKAKQAEYLGLEEVGGKRTPKGRAILVPVGARLNKHGNMTKKYVKRRMENKKVFSGTIKGKHSGKQIAGIWQRTGGKRRRGLKLLVRYESRTKYKPKLGFQDTVRPYMQRRFQKNFQKTLNEVLR